MEVALNIAREAEGGAWIGVGASKGGKETFLCIVPSNLAQRTPEEAALRVVVRLHSPALWK